MVDGLCIMPRERHRGGGNQCMDSWGWTGGEKLNGHLYGFSDCFVEVAKIPRLFALAQFDMGWRTSEFLLWGRFARVMDGWANGTLKLLYIRCTLWHEKQWQINRRNARREKNFRPTPEEVLGSAK